MMRSTRVRPTSDHGSVAIVVLMTAVAWALAMVLAVGPVVRHLADRQRAQAAADAAALAAVLKDCDAAASIAARNGADLGSCERHPAPAGVGFLALVTVNYGETTASARASTGP